METGRCRNFGFGKLDFLSTASTVLWKRRNRASARTNVDSKSIVVESSLTDEEVMSAKGQKKGCLEQGQPKVE